MRLLLAILLSLTVIAPSMATVIFKDPASPTLKEINEGLQACKTGIGECKFERYPGVVRTNTLGFEVGPNDPRYILGDVLEPGTALPYVHDPKALVNALKKKKVTIVSFHLRKTSLWTYASLTPLENDLRHIIVPDEIIELAVQNGMSAHDMYIYLESNIGKEYEALIAQINEQHNAIVSALNSEITALTGQVAALEATIASLTAEHAATVAVLENQLESLKAQNTSIILDNAQLKSQLETALSAVAALVSGSVDGQDWKPGDALPQHAANSATATTTANKITGGISDFSLSGQNDGSCGSNITCYEYDGEYYTEVVDTLYEQIAHELKYYGYTALLSHTSFLTDLDSRIVQALEESYAAGYDDGYADGYAQGYSDGYSDGFSDGVKSVSN